MTISRKHIVGGSLAAIAAAAVLGGMISSGPDPAFQVNAEGELIRPTNYRSWIFVGTPVTPNDMNNGKAAFPEMHNVYIDPASYEVYKHTGKFRDGTVLVKELVSVGTKQASSGNGYFEGEFIGLETAIKSKDLFRGDPGNWGYYSFTNEDGGDLKATTTAFPAASCNSCHAAAAADDFVFTQYYPVLRSAKGRTTQNSENDAARPKTLGVVPVAPVDDAVEVANDQAPDPAMQPTAPTPASVSGTDVPTGTDELFKYLSSHQYRDWTNRESVAHPSRGPHSAFGKPVRTYINDSLAASMSNRARSHATGATAVKEMFDDSDQLIGWAVAIKTARDSKDGKGWFWYEVLDTSDGSSPVAIGNGIAGCTGCHARGGSDYIQTSWPLH